jgi:hypothetical protein
VLQLERDALHIYVGIFIMLLTAAVTRWRLDQWRVLVPVLVLALANEAADLLYDPWLGEDLARQWGESVRDMINSLAVPILLLLIVRRVRR